MNPPEVQGQLVKWPFCIQEKVDAKVLKSPDGVNRPIETVIRSVRIKCENGFWVCLTRL